MSGKEKSPVPNCPEIPPAPPKKGDVLEGTPYTLQHPLQLGDRTVESVTPRRLTGKDQLEIEREIRAVDPENDYGRIGSGERMMRLIGKSCGLIFEDVQQMDATDINALSGRIDAFL